ncbi:hypothetical protein AK88_04567 [Plasmodium fragile]|uniref:Uncharacterized protein n=1 Tax=Plasmodium fragile TaxID=5857 RepID=A0A0D9QFP7_PLAFR|nr:uncharacterized protein AK88_04567 [Plasmodium fragile]KJP85808.1 hypothetical protein AK88_04567 [Plasmodium fragile]
MLIQYRNRKILNAQEFCPNIFPRKLEQMQKSIKKTNTNNMIAEGLQRTNYNTTGMSKYHVLISRVYRKHMKFQQKIPSKNTPLASIKKKLAKEDNITYSYVVRDYDVKFISIYHSSYVKLENEVHHYVMDLIVDNTFHEYVFSNFLNKIQYS